MRTWIPLPWRQASRLPWLLALAASLGVALATAATPDGRGWTQGKPAANAARVLGPLEREVRLDLPESLMKQLSGPTLLVYFSPTCPHCQAAQPELTALAERLAGKADVVGVSSGRVPQDVLDGYVLTYQVPYRMVRDADGRIAQALAVQSTPSAVLVRPDKKQAVVVDFWYPYQRGFDTLVEMRLLDDPWKAFRTGEYAGSEPCSACHVQEADSWALTHHSIAWRTLVEREEDDNPACTGCHVTGNGQPTGWAGEADSPLVNVGCEACHGPGGPHDGERTDAKTTCAQCHDAKHSIAFSVEKGLPLIDHYRATAMDDAAFAAARKALLKGETERRLLAFADGKTVGAATCKDCHAGEHAAWAGSAHAKAMGTLPEADRGKVECVRCHATPKETGLPPQALDGYRVDEGVGCESCHGPGDAHVASRGDAGTIEGLGEDCPVCVLEAVCTSCHTPEWDEDWDLDGHLAKIRHGAK